jgi:putative membrane protein
MLAAALAHHPAPDVALSWTWDPLSLVIICATLSAYGLGLAKLWRTAGIGSGIKPLQAACFGLAELSLSLALLSPLDRLSDGLFAAHMSQHELLMVVAAPLMVVGRPLTAYLWALPTGIRIKSGRALHQTPARWAWRFLSAPLFVLVLHGAVRWLWHVPALFEGAMKNEAIHAVQHTPRSSVRPRCSGGRCYTAATVELAMVWPCCSCSGRRSTPVCWAR